MRHERNPPHPSVDSIFVTFILKLLMTLLWSHTNANVRRFQPQDEIDERRSLEEPQNTGSPSFLCSRGSDEGLFAGGFSASCDIFRFNWNIKQKVKNLLHIDDIIIISCSGQWKSDIEIHMISQSLSIEEQRKKNLKKHLSEHENLIFIRLFLNFLQSSMLSHLISSHKYQIFLRPSIQAQTKRMNWMPFTGASEDNNLKIMSQDTESAVKFNCLRLSEKVSRSIFQRAFTLAPGSRDPVPGDRRSKSQLIFIYAHLCVDGKICIINNYSTFLVYLQASRRESGTLV